MIAIPSAKREKENQINFILITNPYNKLTVQQQDTLYLTSHLFGKLSLKWTHYIILGVCLIKEPSALESQRN